MEHRRTSVSLDANIRLPKGVTEAFIEKVHQLPTSLKSDYLKKVFLDKFVSESTDTASVRRSRAIEKWLSTEERNAQTNERLLNTHEGFNILPRVEFSRFMDKLTAFIRDVIGDMPPPDSLIGGFSGGASTSRSRLHSHPAKKFLGQAHITDAAFDWFADIYPDMPVWADSGALEVSEVKGNVMFTVPKSTVIDRCACKEPDLNMFMQRGLGTSIRRSLKRVGIDLNDQSRNRDLAREGSKDSSLCTLDLSSASDSVCSAFVLLALPPLWHTVLNDLRSPVTTIDGVDHVNEMFSSMGNGFTFELESLLFYSLARTTAYFEGISGVISVYGDDIIAPSELASPLMWVLSYFGFSVNPEKSFWEGPFRESCGGHFTNGLDITPFYLRKPLTHLCDAIHMANSLRGWSEYEGWDQLDPEIYDLWSWLISFVPHSFRGGRNLGSIYQVVTPDLPRHVLVPRTNKEYHHLGGYLLWLSSAYSRISPSSIQTSVSNQTKDSCRKRRYAGIVTKLKHYFPQEVLLNKDMPGFDPGVIQV